MTPQAPVRLTFEQAEEFVRNPTRSYQANNPYQDRTEFRNTYSSFIEYIKHELNRLIESNNSDLDARRSLAILKSQYHEVRTKIDSFAYHSGIALLPQYRYNKSSRKSRL